MSVIDTKQLIDNIADLMNQYQGQASTQMAALDIIAVMAIRANFDKADHDRVLQEHLRNVRLVLGIPVKEAFQ